MVRDPQCRAGRPIAANPREGSRLLRFWVKVPNTSSEIGTTLSRARACGRHQQRTSSLGLTLTPPGVYRTVPQWQKSHGCLILTAALELSGNQVTHFFSTKKNTREMIRMMELLIGQYSDRRKLYLSWDAASWHISKELFARIEVHNTIAATEGGPVVATAPLPAGAQFLNVIESVFSGMARAIIHNSDYNSVDAAKEAIDQYFEHRNAKFRLRPKRAGKRIWGHEREPALFSDANNCKDPRYR